MAFSGFKFSPIIIFLLLEILDIFTKYIYCPPTPIPKHNLAVVFSVKLYLNKLLGVMKIPNSL